MRQLQHFLWYLSALGVAGYAAVAYGFLPLGSLVHPEMREAFLAEPWGIYAHVFASAVALALGPFQLSPKLRQRSIRWHRRLGRVYLVGVLIGGVAGLIIARNAFGGMVSTAGFSGLAIAWLGTGASAYLAIRRGDVASHRRYMVRNVALTFAAVTLRIGLGVFGGVLRLPFEVYYPLLSWACWVPNLILAELWLQRHPQEPRDWALAG